MIIYWIMIISNAMVSTYHSTRNDGNMDHCHDATVLTAGGLCQVVWIWARVQATVWTNRNNYETFLTIYVSHFRLYYSGFTHWNIVIVYITTRFIGILKCCMINPIVHLARLMLWNIYGNGEVNKYAIKMFLL